SEPRITAHSTCLIAQDTDLRGEITLSQGCIVHPRATIIAASGPIIMDAGCVVEENAVILNRRKEVMRIGKGNQFMVGCRTSPSTASIVHPTVRAKYVGVEAASIGNHITFKPKSKVSSQIAVSDYCTFGPGTVTLASDPESTALETLEPYTVVYGSLSERRKWDGSAGETERAVKDKEREYLREIMPK
ncbi:uncharacterized protein MKK02DRAFT_23186, partial [Dioszegia hungarica]